MTVTPPLSALGAMPECAACARRHIARWLLGVPMPSSARVCTHLPSEVEGTPPPDPNQKLGDP